VNIEAERTSGEEVDELLDRALETTEEALAQVTRLAIQRIRRGAETPPHLEAAERDLRSALRQLASLRRERRVSPH
jgi:outer membrane protein TolC